MDRVSRYGVAAGGLGVVFALGLIFFYLFYEVSPLLKPARIVPVTEYRLPGDGSFGVADLVTERYTEVAGMFTRDGRFVFFEAADGTPRKDFQAAVPEGVEVLSYGQSETRYGLVAYGLSDGRAWIAQHEYSLTYPEDRRHVEPTLLFPLGEEPVPLMEEGSAADVIAVQTSGRGYAVAGASRDGTLSLAVYAATVSFLTGEVQIERTAYRLPPVPGRPIHLLVNKTTRDLFVADDAGMVHHYDIVSPTNARLVDSVRVVPQGVDVTAMRFLSGTVSIIVGGSDGSLNQWFLVRDEENRYGLTWVRDFKSHPAAITFIAPEYARKGFLAGDASGTVGAYFTTSGRSLLQEKVADAPITAIAVSPVNNTALVTSGDGALHYFNLHNRHPEVSPAALWNRVWYENRGSEEFVWQSSSGSDDFEPKLSLVPLTLGTLKAAVFAMLFAMPLAIFGAIYSAYFMTPIMRSTVKPTIEVMEALPTVILGFLAGLWLAPFIENNLPSVFSIFLLTPLAVLLFALVWSRLPASFRQRVPAGWEAALLVPVILLTGWGAVAASPYLEIHLFGGSMRQWLTDVGITYDQRNALVVGIAMGFAVIPTIFSIAEDAVFNVPKHLTQGSLALGATPWQTVAGVVVPTASPGIFAAVMMGFGRAVGETMIVLMATGNSPVVNFNIFEGMRTLSASIAVELPETPVGSTHFRILFLAALVLLFMTFFVNTLAEIIRQRLRRRYSNL